MNNKSFVNLIACHFTSPQISFQIFVTLETEGLSVLP
ncbi:hypothetical protein TcasGA2_TC032081 [Tribolium castaneum]|uniref:Uncharacterized protein n=1 Tax=Tribolium castaneum TaxID=7070 RepID=A0A139WMP6_TRICA|nr:hypothetical protein TcasGA2_TC032081 [Tribolium castaneum]